MQTDWKENTCVWLHHTRNDMLVTTNLTVNSKKSRDTVFVRSPPPSENIPPYYNIYRTNAVAAADYIRTTNFQQKLNDPQLPFGREVQPKMGNRSSLIFVLMFSTMLPLLLSCVSGSKFTSKHLLVTTKCDPLWEKGPFGIKFQFPVAAKEV